MLPVKKLRLRNIMCLPQISDKKWKRVGFEYVTFDTKFVLTPLYKLQFSVYY